MNRSRFDFWPAVSLLALLASLALLAVSGARLFSRPWLTVSGAELRAVGVESRTVARAKEMLQDLAGADLLRLDFEDLRRRLEDLPGAAEATTRRGGRRLIVELRPRAALARWADGGLVSARGALYAGKSALSLPVFSGDEKRAAEMAEFYHSAREILAARELAPAQLDLSAGGDWRVVLENGVAVYLGRESPHGRLRRFARHYPQTAAKYARIETADMRYPRGFAVRGELLPAREEVDGVGEGGVGVGEVGVEVSLKKEERQ